jgi:hypothetical protein
MNTTAPSRYNATLTLTIAQLVELVLAAQDERIRMIQKMTDADLDLIENNLKHYIRNGGARRMARTPGSSRSSCRQVILPAVLQIALNDVASVMNQRAMA